MPHPHAVIFDMDGLMLDTESISMQAMKKATKQLGLAVEDQWLFDIIGMNHAGSMGYFQEKLGHPLPDNLDDLYIKTYSEHIQTHGIERKGGLIELLDYLKAQNIRSAVATSTRSEMAHKKLKMTDIHHYFEHIVCGDEVDNGKPAPDIYLRAAGLLGLDTAHCIALEDSDNGAKAAHAADIDVIVIPDLKQPKDHTRQLAHKVVTNLHDVRIYLDEMTK